MEELTKSQRKALRDFAAQVYEIEASQVLEELESDFQKWRHKEIDCDTLFQLIHRFHQVRSKELWSTYQALKPPEVVARGVALQFIKESDLPGELRDHLAPLIAFFSGNVA